MNWFTLAIASVFALALAELTQQKLLNKNVTISGRSSAFFTFLFQAIFSLPFILFSDLRNEWLSVLTTGVIWKMILVSIIGSISMTLYLNSFKVKDISISVIFISLSVVVSTTLGIIFFNESTAYIKFIGILLVLLGVISLNFRNLYIEKNHYYGLLAGLLIGVAYVFDKFVVTNIHPLIYISWVFTFIPLISFLINPREIINTIRTTKVDIYKLLFISSLGYFTYNVATFTSYTMGGEVGRVDAINNAQVFLIIFYEYLILKRQTGLIRKIVTAAIAFAGIIILGLN